MLKEFKEFITRGNVLDLAVAIVIGAAYTLVVNSLVKDVLMQIVSAIVGKPDFSSLTFKLGDAQIFYGNFLTALINFLIVAAAMFLVIKGITTLQKLRKPSKVEEAEATEIELLTEIRDALVGRTEP
ncbi:MAG: large conductance mechanosensitive channel protein MscL [Acidimicrobiales bacterium]